MTYEQQEEHKLGVIDKTISIATLIICYIITAISIILLISLISFTPSDGTSMFWVWIITIFIFIYGAGGIAATHIYLNNGQAKNWVTFYKVTAAIIVTMIIVNSMKDNE